MSGRPDGSIIIDTKVDESGFNRGISSLKSAAKGGALAIGAGILAVGAAVGAFAIKGVQLASSLQEVQNVVDVTFGDNAKVVGDWAKAAGKNYGLSELAAKRYASTLGAMFKSQGLSSEATKDMSTSLAGLSGDLASFYNLSQDDAFDKIRAGIAGETEPLRQLGIDLSDTTLQAYALAQGIEKPTAKMTQAEKSQLRYGLLMKQTADAQGDFARTSDSFANQQRTLTMTVESLASSFGAKLLPSVSKAAGGLQKMLAGEKGGAEEFSSALGQMAKDAAGIVTKVAPAVISGLTSVIIAVAQALPAMLPALTAAVIEGLRAIGAALPAIIPALVEGLNQVVMLLAAALPDIIPMFVDAFVLLIGAIGDKMPTLLPVLIPALIRLVIALSGALIAATPILARAFVQTLHGLTLGLQAYIPTLVAAIPAQLTKIKNAFIAGVPKLVDAGKQLVVGIWNGAWDKGGWLVAKLKSFAANVTQKLKDFFGIKSPSKLFEQEIGVNLALGVGKGFSRSVKGVFGDMARSVNGEMARFGSVARPSALSAASGSQTSSSTTINFNRPVRTYSEMVRAQSDIERGLAGGY